MKSADVKDPKDDKIINKDDSVTNKDGNSNLEKGEKSSTPKDSDKDALSEIIPGNDNPELYEAADESSNEGPELSSEKPIV